MTLPPGPRAPGFAQLAEYWLRPLPLLERCRRRHGDAFTLRLGFLGTTVVLAAPADVRRVSAADKLHNARAVLHDYRHQGERLWRRFNAGTKDQLWYYRSLVEVLKKGHRRPGPLVRELERVVFELEQAVEGR